MSSGIVFYIPLAHLILNVLPISLTRSFSSGSPSTLITVPVLLILLHAVLKKPQE